MELGVGAVGVLGFAAALSHLPPFFSAFAPDPLRLLGSMGEKGKVAFRVLTSKILPPPLLPQPWRLWQDRFILS